MELICCTQERESRQQQHGRLNSLSAELSAARSDTAALSAAQTSLKEQALASEAQVDAWDPAWLMELSQQILQPPICIFHASRWNQCSSHERLAVARV